MLAIARTLMTNPALLLLDEPLEGLAPIIVEELLGVLRQRHSQGGHVGHRGRAEGAQDPGLHRPRHHSRSRPHRLCRRQRRACRRPASGSRRISGVAEQRQRRLAATRMEPTLDATKPRGVTPMPDSTAPLPRRRGRQPAAHRSPSRTRAPSARRAQITPTELEEDRGRGDQEDHQEAGGGRPAARHRRRVPPLLVAFRFLLAPQGLRARGARPRHPVPGHPDQAREPARDGQARFPGRPPDARAFQVPEGQHQGHAEDDHPLAVGDALPRRAQCHQQGRPIPSMDAYFDDLGKALRQGDQGLLRRRLPLPAARRHGVGLSVLQGADGAGARSAARMPTSSPASTPR